MIKAIVYTSNTGNTRKYAQLLGKEINIPVLEFRDALNQLSEKIEIIYFGWIMAGGIKGYKEVNQHFSVKAACGVGMKATGSQNIDVRERNQIPEDIAVFTLQGGYEKEKLKGINKFMMNMVAKASLKELSQKDKRTAADEDMIDLLNNGGNRVNLKNLKSVIEWYQAQKGVAL